MVAVHCPHRRFHFGAAALKVVLKLVFTGQDVHKDVVHPARTVIVEEANPFEMLGFSLRLHAPRFIADEIGWREWAIAAGADPLHGVSPSRCRRGFASGILAPDIWGIQWGG